MAIRALPRNVDGGIALPGAYSRKWTADFTTLTALPAWLVATASGGTAATATVSGGELILTGTDSTASAYVTGPAIDLTTVKAVRFTVTGSYIATTSRSDTVHGLSTWTDIWSATTGVNIGVMMHAAGVQPSNMYLRHTQADWPVTSIPQYKIDENYAKTTARTTRSLIYIPATKMAYSVEDRDDVRMAREMTNVNAASVNPIWGMRRPAAGLMDLRCRGIEIEVFYP